MELLWYGVVVAFILGSAVSIELSSRTPRCYDCHTFTLMLSQQIPDSSPPVFEVVYRCPSCWEVLQKRFVSTISD